jgi:cytochrome c oxidase subunit I
MTTTAERPAESVFRRPRATTGAWSWFTTVDHKKIGLLYFWTALGFFVVGGILALIMRTQLARPEGQIVSADVYSQLFTMHALTMVFFAVMPLGAAFFNYLLPLLVGARDVAFPRFNAFSYWVFLAAGLFTYSGLFLGGLPDSGWFGYAPLSVVTGDSLGETIAAPELRMVFYSLGLQLAGIATLASSVNFIVTILNMRAPGLTMFRLPIFVWVILVVSILALFAIPVIGVALWALLLDSVFQGNFFLPARGGNPLLWQHLFWIFGHPEVYILILPAFGIVAEIIPTFARKPLFGYKAFVFAIVLIGLLSWGVWGHHMLATDLGKIANTGFSLTTMAISIPTGVIIFVWLATLFGGRIRYTTPMLFALGLIVMFTIGGLSGVTHAEPAHNMQQTDTYYIVAHIHYVLFGGAILGLFAGVYYWYPKVTGRLMSERLGRLHFWLAMIGMNLVFGPFHILGLWGMPRRQYTFPDGLGWNLWNLVATVGAYIVALSVLVFIVNLFWSNRHGAAAGHDPWDARTLEWVTRSPTPEHNYDFIPLVEARDEFWQRKYGLDGIGPRPRAPAPEGTPGEPGRAPIRGGAGDIPPEPPAGGRDPDPDPDRTAGAAGRTAVAIDEHAGPHRDPATIHLPSPSYYPLVVAVGLPVMAYGLFVHPVLLALGAVLVLGGAFGWVTEPSAEEHHGEEHA